VIRQAQRFASFTPQAATMPSFLKQNLPTTSLLKTSLPTTSLLATFAVALLFLLGCQQEEPLTSYTVARTSPPRPPLDAAAVLQQLDHILVAIVPQDDQAWFFKMVGKAPAIGRQRKAFDSFLSTVKLADSSSLAPSWELPAGWKEQDASAMRAATLVVPDNDGDLEIAVSSLPLTVSWEEFLQPNVNRWLRQLQQKSLPQSTVLKLARPASTGDGKAKATVFELSGAMAQQSMGGAHSATGPAPRAASAPQRAPSEKPLTYQMPDGWQPGKLSVMRKAAFLLPAGGPSDEVTVTSFPAVKGTQMDDVAANVQRWAGQVGLAPPRGDRLDQLTKPITISGIEGTYVELMSPAEATRDMALFAAMIKRDDQVWFFKMVGSGDLVSGQRAAFREFLGSVRFP